MLGRRLRIQRNLGQRNKPLFDSFLERQSNFSCALKRRGILDKARRPTLVFAKMSSLQAICVDSFDDLSQQCAKPSGYLCQLLIEWILEHVLVDVPHQVD